MAETRSSSSSGGGGGGCGGCLSMLVLGTLIVGTIALGGCRPAWHKIKSLWNYDNQITFVKKAMDKDGNNVLSDDERREMYHGLGLTTIEGEPPSVRIPYENLLKFSKQYGQEP